MILNTVVHKKEVHPNKLNSQSYRANAIGFWAEVAEVNSVANACTVINAQGLRFTDIPLCSNEWVVNKNDFVASERNLPPVGARVFVLIPAGDISGAFILCSGYPINEPSLQKVWAADKSEKEKKNNSYERITQSGWNITEDYTNGNVIFESQDKNVKIEINIEEKNTKISAWENEILADESGINIEDKNGNTIVSNDSGVQINDVNNNSFVMGESSVKINGNLEVLQ